MRPILDCSNIETSPQIHREEEGKEIFFRHSEFDLVCNVVGVDSCIFKNTVGERSCDYLFLFDRTKQHYNFLNNKSSLAYYVELKGIDLVGACEQLHNSIEKTMKQIESFNINALVVSTREFIPKYDNNEFYRAVKRLIRKDIQFEITPYTVNL
jgi:hypothetical protein